MDNNLPHPRGNEFMIDKRLIELLTKKLAGEASQHELIELKTLLSEYPDASDTEDIFNQIWDSPIIEEDISSPYERHKMKYGSSLDSLHQTETVIDSVSSEPARFRYTLAGLGLVLLLVSLGLLVFRNRPPGLAKFTQIIAGKGVRKPVILPDGTKAWLNGDSRLSYDPKMKNASTRLVSLAGEAFFDVAPDAQHPFIIDAGKVSIKVLGTVLNVMAYPNEKKCETTLLRGSVELTINDDSKQKFLLKPSEKFTLGDQPEKTTRNGPGNNGGTTLLIEHITQVKAAGKEYVPETSWIDNKLVFENETLDEIVLKLARWYPNVKLNIADTVGHYRFTGVFENETIERVLAAMQLIQSFKIKKNEEEEIMIY